MCVCIFLCVCICVSLYCIPGFVYVLCACAFYAHVFMCILSEGMCLSVCVCFVCVFCMHACVCFGCMHVSVRISMCVSVCACVCGCISMCE